MSKKNSIDSIEKELKKYDAEMSNQMRMELSRKEKHRDRFFRRLPGISGILVLFIGIIFYFAQKQEGNHMVSVYLDQEILYKKGIDLSETGNFEYVGSHLNSERLPNQMVTTETAVSDQICQKVEGSWSGDGYMVYSFYLRNAGWEDTGYQATLKVNSIFRHSEPVLRAKVWHNGEPVTCRINDKNDKEIYVHREENFLQGYVEKYTVAVWLEKNDPNYREEMKDGRPQLVMNIDPL